jgi:hypothetical protein
MQRGALHQLRARFKGPGSNGVPAARGEFQKARPCPANGNATGPYPGYVVDHVVPLKRGRTDSPENMQWQSKAEAVEKDRRE